MTSNINIISATITIFADLTIFVMFFFSIHTVQFEQLHKYIKKRNKIYKKWYTQKQSLDIKLFGISRKQKKKKIKRNKKGMLAQKVLSHLLL